MRPILFALILLVMPVSGFARPADPSEIVILFQRQKDPAAIKASADKVAANLTAELKRPVSVMIPGDYAASVQALVSKRADVAYMSSLPFLLARRDGGAKLILAENRKDTSGKARTDYDSVFVVPADSPLKSYDDLRKQAKNLRIAFTSSTSTSGYVFPYARFVQSGLLKRAQKPETLFKQVQYAGGYTQALEQVASGRADVAAVSDYTMEGAKADVYLPAEKRQQLRILARTPGVPTHLIAVRGDLDGRLVRQIKAALLKLSAENPQLLSDVYGAQALVPVNERRHVAPTVAAIKATGMPIEGLAK